MTFRIGSVLRSGGWAGFLGLLAWAAAWMPAMTEPARAPLASRSGPARRPTGRAAPSMVPGAGRGGREAIGAAEDRPDLAEICSRAEGEGEGAAGEEIYGGAVASWMAANAHAAAKIIRELDVPSPVRLRLEAQLMAERDFASAYEWADRLPNSDDRIPALSSVLYEGALDAPEAVLELARGADLGDKKPVVLRTIGLRCGRPDGRAADE